MYPLPKLLIIVLSIATYGGIGWCLAYLIKSKSTKWYARWLSPINEAYPNAKMLSLVVSWFLAVVWVLTFWLVVYIFASAVRAGDKGAHK